MRQAIVDTVEAVVARHMAALQGNDDDDDDGADNILNTSVRKLFTSPVSGT